MPNIEPYYTVKEIAELFKIAESTASDWIVSGRFGDTLNDGKRHLVPESALRSFIERNTGPAVTYMKHLGGGRTPKFTVKAVQKLDWNLEGG